VAGMGWGGGGGRKMHKEVTYVVSTPEGIYMIVYSLSGSLIGSEENYDYTKQTG
jgi:hypothetical protein